jgi:hypothetical protein
MIVDASRQSLQRACLLPYGLAVSWHVPGKELVRRGRMSPGWDVHLVDQVLVVGFAADDPPVFSANRWQAWTSWRPTPDGAPGWRTTESEIRSGVRGNGEASREVITPPPVVGMVPPAGCPRQDSNLRSRFRRPVLYPLSYGGGES